VYLDSNGNSKISNYKWSINYKEETVFGLNLDKDGLVTDSSNKVLEYRSPEEVTISKRIEYSTDYWALGISMFKMFTGRFPFFNKKSIINDSIPNLKELETSQEAKEVLTNLLNKNHFERWVREKIRKMLNSIHFLLKLTEFFRFQKNDRFWVFFGFLALSTSK